MNNQEKLKSNYDYIIEHREKLLPLYRNKFVLIYEKEVVGSFDSYEAAATTGINNYGTEGNFLVYEMTENEPINFVFIAE